MNPLLKTLRTEVLAELEDNILPFWTEKMPDRRHGGFLGSLDGTGRPRPGAADGCGYPSWLAMRSASSRHMRPLW